MLLAWGITSETLYVMGFARYDSVSEWMSYFFAMKIINNVFLFLFIYVGPI